MQLIDLDAAMGRGGNHQLIAMICKQLPCQVGGGIRDVGRARELLDLGVGAQRVIFGSALVKDGKVNVELVQELCSQFGIAPLTFAIDSRGGKVAVKGWKEITAIDPLEMIHALEPYCSAFLYTHIDTEGTMTGFPVEVVEKFRQATKRRLIVAGGVKSLEEVKDLDAMGVDAVVGMAIYKGVIDG